MFFWWKKSDFHPVRSMAPTLGLETWKHLLMRMYSYHLLSSLIYLKYHVNLTQNETNNFLQHMELYMISVGVYCVSLIYIYIHMCVCYIIFIYWSSHLHLKCLRFLWSLCSLHFGHHHITIASTHRTSSEAFHFDHAVVFASNTSFAISLGIRTSAFAGELTLASYGENTSPIWGRL